MRKAKYARQMSVSLPEEIISQITEITDKEEISIAEWIREAIENALEIERSREGGNE